MLLLAGATALAAEEPAPAEAPAPAAPAPEPASAEPAKFFDWKWEGAIGPIVSLSPEYSGSAARKVSVVPGFYLRYGRISISNASGFVTRRSNDDILRGLGLDMVRNNRVRVNLALRIDNGRRSSGSKALAGIEDVRRTLRGRASVTWQLDDGWKVTGGWTADLLGRGGGNLFDAGVSHDRRISPDTTWSIGAGLSAGDHRYLQSYYGVNASESAASGYPVYTPGAGLRDVAIGTGWRTEINPRWVALWGGSVGRLLGPAAASPLTTSTRQWGVSAGIAWRF